MLVLVVNCGSSSLKYQLFDMRDETILAKGLAERVSVAGGRDAVLTHQPAATPELRVEAPMADHSVAVALVLDALTHPVHGVVESLAQIGAVGHRVVHGGEAFARSVLITPEVLQAIERCAELAPLHNPANLMGIRAAQRHLPHVPHVAVFDTAFHQTMPRRAWLYGLPYELYEKYGIRRYGFHGTSHLYVSQIAGEFLESRGIPRQEQKIITCHLGNGCSMAAVLAGQSIDTSMGFTPLEGLLMGTRCGDLDPAIIPFLMERLGMTTDEVEEYTNRKAGLLGVSGVSSDMRDISAAAAAGNDRAVAAIELFCYRVRKYIGAYAAAMGGVHAVVFTAGIGENNPEVRRRCVEGLEFLGIKIDPERNQATPKGEPAVDISAPDATAHVLVIPTNEELLIARDTAAIVSQSHTPCA
ncbi:MAG: acetate kinase [Armatimonadetes bacterium]|nr:acetate kinase [Armatimonadota bacterium]